MFDAYWDPVYDQFEGLEFDASQAVRLADEVKEAWAWILDPGWTPEDGTLADGP